MLLARSVRLLESMSIHYRKSPIPLVYSFICLGSLLFLCLKRFLEYLNWNFDDALIVYRIVNNFVAGQGWAYNVGELHNASTSVLNTLVIAGLTVVLKDPSLAAHILGALWIALLAMAVWYSFARRVGPVWALFISGSLVELLSTASIWGLETDLFQLLLVVFVICENLTVSSWAVLGLLTLTRPDGILLVGLKWIKEFCAKRTISHRGVLLFLLIISPWALYSLVKFGQIFPDTLSNKVWQGRSGFWGTGPIYLKALAHHLLDCSNLMKFFVCAGVIGFFKLVVLRDNLLFIFVFALLQQIAYILLNVPGYHWYFVTLDVSLILASVGFFEIIGLNANLVFAEGLVRRFKSEGFSLAIMTLALIYSTVELTKVLVGVQYDVRDLAYRRVIEEINQRKFPDGPIALLEVGTIGFHSNRKIIDLLGLASANPQYITTENLDLFFGNPPRLVVLHDPPWHFELALHVDPRFRVLYPESYSVTSANYSSMRYYNLKELPPGGIEQAFANYREALPIAQSDQLAGVVTVPSASCVLDAWTVDGKEPSTDSNVGQSIVIQAAGWAVDTALSEPGQAKLVLKSDSSAFVAQAERAARPDVAKYLGSGAFEQAGFRLEARFQGLEPKTYELFALIEHGQNRGLCNLNRRITVHASHHFSPTS